MKAAVRKKKMIAKSNERRNFSISRPWTALEQYLVGQTLYLIDSRDLGLQPLSRQKERACMALSSEEITDGQDDWVDLEAIFISRTVHLHCLSALHLPDLSLGTADRELKQSDLDSFALRLKTHLDARLSQPLLFTLGGLRGQDAQFIQRVRASFLPSSSRIQTKGTPKPFAVEIEVKQPSPSQSNPNRTRLETAHLLFFSTTSRQTHTHYPVVFWKPLLSARVAPLDLQNGEIDVDAAQAAVAARLLTSQTLYFVTAYFGCRISPLAPLHGIRGRNLEDLAEAVAGNARKHSNLLAMELTFALPDVVDPLDDGRIVEGPAPELNTISLSVPGQVTEELLQGASLDTPVMPAIQRYLSEHTSLQISRLTLTRVGVGNVYLGAPTSTVTPAGRPSTGEVRLKISRDASNGSQRDLIETVVSQIVRTASQEHW
jgi:hypothetical protein